MAAELLTDLSRATDANSSPLAGAKWYFYATGTTTPQAVYDGADLLTSLGAAVTADGGGQFPPIYFDASIRYRGILKTALGVTIKDIDPVNTGALSDLSADSGSSLVGFKYAGTGAQPTTVANVLQHAPLNLKEFAGLADGSVFTDAYRAAIAAGYRTFYLPAGTYYFDAGNNGYGAQLVSGVQFFGDGEQTVIRRSLYGPQGDGSSRGTCFLADSGGADVFVDDIRFENMKFVGDVLTHGHDETYGHFFALSGVRRAYFNNIHFVGPCSDAIGFFSIGGGAERHNHDLSITNCIFDGVINGVDGGRNAISVIDGDGVYIAGNVFKNWSRNDMPGCIDFEPNDPFGIIKNVRVIGNDFRNCAGNRGHVTLATVHTPAENMRNIVIASNTFDGSTAVCIYTDADVPSPFPTVKQNIVIADNVGTNLAYLVDKVNGPIFGLSIIDNIGDGPVRLGNATADYIMKDVLVADNQISTTAAHNLLITNPVENLTIRNNIFRGATTAHLALGDASTSTYAVSIIGNRFIGAPSSGMALHSAGTHNPESNIWENNIGDPGITHSFRAYRTDFVGALWNLHAIGAAPNTFPYGVSTVEMRNVSGPTGNDTGILQTSRHSSGDIKRTWQWFTPEYSSGELTKTYYRRAIDNTTWSAWKTVTAT